jgi:hypothetical protein
MTKKAKPKNSIWFLFLDVLPGQTPKTNKFQSLLGDSHRKSHAKASVSTPLSSLEHGIHPKLIIPMLETPKLARR